MNKINRMSFLVLGVALLVGGLGLCSCAPKAVILPEGPPPAGGIKVRIVLPDNKIPAEGVVVKGNGKVGRRDVSGNHIIAGVGGGKVNVVADVKDEGRRYLAVRTLIEASKQIGKAIENFWDGLIQKLSDSGRFLGKVASTALSIVKAIWDFGKKIVTSLGGVLKSLFSVFSLGGKGGYRDLGGSLLSAMFKFELLKQAIRGVITELKAYINTATQAAITLQKLEIRLDNLLARQIHSAGITQDYGESMQEASRYTKDMLMWIRELAVATPFSEEAISKTASLTLAMGWGIESTKTLTESILDYSAAQGLSNDVMERIIYNFAQMRQAGKVTGTELRDLTRGALMPVNDILNEAAKQLGISSDSMAEFRDKQLTVRLM